MIIRREKKLTIPDEPKIDMPEKPQMAFLGTKTADCDDHDEKYAAKEEEVLKDAKILARERQARGDFCMYTFCQPWLAPAPARLAAEKMRIDYYSSFDIEGGEHMLRWCQGEVKDLIDVNKEEGTAIVNVLWDAMPDVKDSEDDEEGTPAYEERVTLDSDKWNKRKKDAWRLDVDIGFFAGSNGDENARDMGDGGNLKRSEDSDSEDEADEEMEESDGDELDLSSESEEDEKIED